MTCRRHGYSPQTQIRRGILQLRSESRTHGGPRTKFWTVCTEAREGVSRTEARFGADWCRRTKLSRLLASGQWCSARQVGCFRKQLRSVELFAARRRQLRAGSRPAWCSLRLLPGGRSSALRRKLLRAGATARRKPRSAVEAAPEAGSCYARRKL